MSKPTEEIEWAEGASAEVEEPDALRPGGFPFGFVPAAQQINWMWRTVGRWVKWLEEKADLQANHVHDGGSEGNSVSKIDANEHISWGDHGGLQVDFESPAEHNISHIHTSGGTTRLTTQSFNASPIETQTLRTFNMFDPLIIENYIGEPNAISATNTPVAWAIIRIGSDNTTPRPVTLLRSYNIASVYWEDFIIPFIRVDLSPGATSVGTRRHAIATAGPYYGDIGEPEFRTLSSFHVDLSAKEDHCILNIIEHVRSGTYPGPYTVEHYDRNRDTSDEDFLGCDIHLVIF